MGWLVSLLTGPLLGQVLTYFQKRADTELAKYQTGVQADTQVILSQVQADIEQRKLAAAAREADRGSLWTAWMLPSIFAVSLFHYGAIVIDSTLKLGWAVHKLPAPYDGMQQTILLSVVGVVAAQRIIARVFTR